METSLQPLCELLLPPGYARTGLRLSVTHQLLTRLPLPLIPFLFGFNEPNPLVSPWRQGGGYSERAVVWGESRKLTLGPGLRGSHAPTRCIHILFNSHNSPMLRGNHTSVYRPGCCLTGLHNLPGSQYARAQSGAEGPPQIIPGRSASPQSCLTVLLWGEHERGLRNPWALPSSHHWLPGL